jgi:hypothetical protein
MDVFLISVRPRRFFLFSVLYNVFVDKKSKIDMLKRAESKGFPLNNKLRAQIRDKTVKVSEWTDLVQNNHKRCQTAQKADHPKAWRGAFWVPH